MPAGEPRLRMLVSYSAWANERIVAALARLSPAELAAPTPIFAGSILRTLNHVCLIDAVWQAHLSDVPHGFTTRNPETTPSFDALRETQRRLDAWYIDYAVSLAPKRRDEVVHFAFIGGGEGAMSRGEILLHVVNHASYHRGNLTAMLYAMRIEPPVTDLPVYLRDAVHDAAVLPAPA